jgi:hypothetical protein
MLLLMLSSFQVTDQELVLAKQDYWGCPRFISIVCEWDWEYFCDTKLKHLPEWPGRMQAISDFYFEEW